VTGVSTALGRWRARPKVTRACRPGCGWRWARARWRCWPLVARSWCVAARPPTTGSDVGRDGAVDRRRIRSGLFAGGPGPARCRWFHGSVPRVEAGWGAGEFLAGGRARVLVVPDDPG